MEWPFNNDGGGGEVWKVENLVCDAEIKSSPMAVTPPPPCDTITEILYPNLGYLHVYIY